MGLAISPARSVVVPPSVVVPLGGLVEGVAVAFRDNAGTPEYVLCGSGPADYPDSFLGFFIAGEPGGIARVHMTRGSLVTPIVEGAIPLVVEQPVYLAATPGEVTQTPVPGPGVRILKVGLAISPTEMLLLTDSSLRFGG